MAMRRTKEGRLQADPKRFPSGIKRLADYVSHHFFCADLCSLCDSAVLFFIPNLRKSSREIIVFN